MTYYKPPHYDFQRPPELDGTKSSHQVAIIGAGPVGLTCALELAKHGVSSVIIDPKNTVCEGSRAVCLARRSMEILQHIDAVTPFVKKSLPWTRGRSFYRDKLVYQLEMPHSEHERFFPMHNLQQHWMEEYLVNSVTSCDRIELRWQSELVGITQHVDRAELEVKTPDGTYRTAARYVIAADGARSAVRTLLNLKLQGDAYEGSYVIVDIQMRSDHPTERRAYFDPPANPGSTLLIHKQPDNIWRLDYQLHDDEDPYAALAEHTVRIRIQAILNMVGETAPWTLEWKSLYKAHSLALDDYSNRHVFFAGDAAHLVPIFGVRGLNSGLADANNLGWKLAYVINGCAPKEILQTYSSERRAATMDIFKEATKSTKFMTPPSHGYSMLRDAVLSLSLQNEFAKGFINPRQSAPYDYTDSSATSFQENDLAFASGPRAGAPAQNVRLTDNDFLIDHLGKGFTGVFFRDTGALSADDEKLTAAMQLGNQTFTPIVFSSHGVIADRYGASHGSFYLFRPDGHVCARWTKINHQQVLAAQRSALGVRHG